MGSHRGLIMRRTRIVATIGPSSDDDKTLLSLLRAGVNVCRLNYSHGEPEQKTELYQRIRQLESELRQPTCILADLPGPKLRLGEFDGIHVLTMKKKSNCTVASNTWKTPAISNFRCSMPDYLQN